jgi:hypothetical protein
MAEENQQEQAVESRYAMLKAKVVVNICIWNGDNNTWTPPEDIEMIKLKDDQFPNQGDLYQDGMFKAPKPDIKVEFSDITMEGGKYTFGRAIITVESKPSYSITLDTDQLHQLSSGKTFERLAQELATLVVKNKQTNVVVPTITV